MAVNGINVAQDGVLNGCVANFNSLQGIVTGPGCVLSSCLASQNTGTGITTGASCTLTSCTSFGNGVSGIICSSNCVLHACSATGNTGNGSITVGIFASYGSTLTDCSGSGNAAQYGILANPGSTIIHCAASLNNSTQPFSAGIFAGACTIKDCTAFGNTGSVSTNTCGMGIYSNGAEGHIQNCEASGNKGDNIYVISGMKLTGNVCVNGSAAGVHVTGNGNSIEGNEFSFNQTGLLMDSAINLVFRNTARGNSTNYSVVAGNRVGTIVTPATSAAISGSSGGTTFTNDSFSNIAY